MENNPFHSESAILEEMRSGRSLLVTTFASASVVTACSLIASVDGEQCASDADCAARGATSAVCTNNVCTLASATTPGPGEGGVTTADGSGSGTSSSSGAPSDASLQGDGPLDCVGGSNPYPIAKGPVTKIDLLFKDLLSDKPIKDIQLLVCASLTDPACTNPAKTVRADDAGHIKFDLDTSTKAFEGYFDIQPIKADGTLADQTGGDPSVYIPSRLYYTNYPLFQDYSDYWLLMRYSSVGLFAATFGQSYDKTQGSAFLISDDCYGTDTGGFSYIVDSLSANTHGFYLQNGTPSTTASQTDKDATGGFINIPTGARTFTMQKADTKKTVSTLTAYVRPNSIVYAKMRPAPFTR